MKQVRYVYIIKKIITTWDGCNGCDSDEYYTNWVFGASTRAYDKCRELNKNYGGRISPGCRIEYKVEKTTLD